MDWLNSDALIGLLTLTTLEIVLGIDNIIFISILAGKLPADQQARARQIGLGLALVTRILLLLSLSWLVGRAWSICRCRLWKKMCAGYQAATWCCWLAGCSCSVKPPTKSTSVWRAPTIMEKGAPCLPLHR